LVVATIEADAFCHHMVRSLVGALMAVGEGRREQIWPQQILTARTRESAGRGGIGAATMSPAQGLTLEGGEYPPDDRLAAQARPPGGSAKEPGAPPDRGNRPRGNGGKPGGTGNKPARFRGEWTRRPSLEGAKPPCGGAADL